MSFFQKVGEFLYLKIWAVGLIWGHNLKIEVHTITHYNDHLTLEQRISVQGLPLGSFQKEEDVSNSVSFH